jgi:hypothetical protein
MRFRLRTLLIVAALGPPVLAALYWMPAFGLTLAVVAMAIVVEVLLVAPRPRPK